MRIPVWLAWVLLALAFFTSGLLRQFHDRTPVSPIVPPVVGSLLFAAIFLLLLVSAREFRRGAVPGRGVRLGSVTPVLLMLLIEKWISISFYSWIFYRLASPQASPALLDAQFLAMAGFGLVLICLLVGRFSAPTARKTWRRSQPARWPVAAIGTLVVVVGSYALLGGLAWALGGGLRLEFPRLSALLVWVLAGQALLAFAEELYYRGLLMSELERLAPRLGARGPAARRWIALLVTAGLFGMEHLRLGLPGGESLRQLVFTLSLGVLLGILVMLSANLHYAAGVHAWINWLLLGAAPRFVDGDGQPALPPGTYIGVALILAFVSAFVFRRTRHGRHHHGPGRLIET